MSATTLVDDCYEAWRVSQQGGRLAPFHWSRTLASLTTPKEARMESINHAAVHHVPWNKGKLVGQKAPLKQREIWAIRIRLQLHKDARELALFNLAIDSKLRSWISCDCESAMSAKADALHLGQSSCSERRSSQSSLRSLNRLVRHFRVGFAAPSGGQTITSSPAACASPGTCPLANTHESFVGGCRASGLIQLHTVRTRCGGPRRR